MSHFQFVNLISDIGGQIGLWLGASILTIVELFSFVLNIGTVYCRNRIKNSTSELDFTEKRRNSSFSRVSDGKPSPRLSDYGATSTPKVSVIRRHSVTSNFTDYSDDENSKNRNAKIEGNHYEMSL